MIVQQQQFWRDVQTLSVRSWFLPYGAEEKFPQKMKQVGGTAE